MKLIYSPLASLVMILLAAGAQAADTIEDEPTQQQNIRGLGHSKSMRHIRECHYDCDRDADCAKGLLCADAHKAELRRAGLDERHAYCNRVKYAYGKRSDPKFLEVCYDPKKVTRNMRNIPECHYDCDKDSDCAKGLLCADAHKAELSRAGLDERHAYCKRVKYANGSKRSRDPKFLEVCYDPKMVA